MAIAFVLCVFLLQAKVNDGIVGEWKLTDVYTNGVKVSIEDLLISGDTDNTVELTAYNDNTVIITNIFNSGTRELLYGNWYQSGDMYYLHIETDDFFVMVDKKNMELTSAYGETLYLTRK